MAGGKPWLKDELSILDACYEASSREKLCSLLPDRKWETIRSKGYKLGLRRPCQRFKKGRVAHNAWPVAESDLLKIAYPKLPPSELHRLFPSRSIRAIRLKALKLGLKRPRERFSETCKKCSKWQTGRQLSLKHRANITEAVRENPPWLGKHLSPEHKQLLSDIAKERVKDPEYMRKILSSRRPTDIEQRIIDVIKKHNLPYKYTGDGTFQVNGKYPDFVNTNNEKIALDVFGDRWHDASEIPERTAIFAEYGWKLIIIWGHEVKSMSEEGIVEKIWTSWRNSLKKSTRSLSISSAITASINTLG